MCCRTAFWDFFKKYKEVGTNHFCCNCLQKLFSLFRHLAFVSDTLCLTLLIHTVDTDSWKYCSVKDLEQLFHFEQAISFPAHEANMLRTTGSWWTVCYLDYFDFPKLKQIIYSFLTLLFFLIDKDIIAIKLQRMSSRCVTGKKQTKLQLLCISLKLLS